MSIKIMAPSSFRDEHVLSHYHDSIELIRIVSGDLNCLIQGQTYHVEKGDLCFINKKQIHRIYCDQDKDCSFRSITINPEMLTADRSIMEKYIKPILLDEDFSHSISSVDNVITRDITGIMDIIINLEQEKPQAYELAIVAFVHFIFQQLYKLYQESKGKAGACLNTDAVLYRKIANFIYENYDQKLSLDDIAKSGNISRSKCCNLFKKYAQNSPIDFLNLYRLEISTGLLKQTNDTIATIAMTCGFGQQSYYNRLFLREYGMTPKEYRQL